MAQYKSKNVKMRRKSPPLIKSPVGPSKRKPTPQERYPSRAHPDVGIGKGRQLEAIDPLRDFTPKEQEMMNKQLEKFLKERLKKHRRVPKRTSPSGTIATKKGGKVVSRKEGTMVTKGKRKKVRIAKGPGGVRPLSLTGQHMPYRRGSQSAIREILQRVMLPDDSIGGIRSGTPAERRSDTQKELARKKKLKAAQAQRDSLFSGKSRKNGGKVLYKAKGRKVINKKKKSVRSKSKGKPRGVHIALRGW